MSEVDRAYRLAFNKIQSSLMEKTSWGRNEIKTLMDKALQEALNEMAEGKNAEGIGEWTAKENELHE